LKATESENVTMLNKRPFSSADFGSEFGADFGSDFRMKKKISPGYRKLAENFRINFTPILIFKFGKRAFARRASAKRSNSNKMI